VRELCKQAAQEHKARAEQGLAPSTAAQERKTYAAVVVAQSAAAVSGKGAEGIARVCCECTGTSPALFRPHVCAQTKCGAKACSPCWFGVAVVGDNKAPVDSVRYMCAAHRKAFKAALATSAAKAEVQTSMPLPQRVQASTLAPHITRAGAPSVAVEAGGAKGAQHDKAAGSTQAHAHSRAAKPHNT